ncbi:MAG: PEGA domain-containing protein [Myxococcales bacterium]|nr:PEGA domain-containing protein [Myxococcales bacterium]
MSLPRLASVVLLLLAGLAAPARAGSLALIVAGEPAKQPVIETTLGPWLSARGYQVQIGVADESVGAKLVDCFVLTDQGCAEPAVAKLSYDSTLFVMVEVHHDTKAQTDEIKLTGWLYGANGKAIVAQSVFCRACRNDTLGPTAEDLAEALFAVQGQGTGIVKITSTPPGAKVLIDGATAGATPWEQGLRTGPHTVTLELPGHRTQTLPIEIKKDETVPVDVAMVPDRGGGGGGKRDPLWLGVAGAGVAALVGGAVLVALDEDPVPTQQFYFDSAPGGFALIGVGAVAVAAGTYLYLRSGKPRARAATAWVVPSGGAGVGLAGSF